MSAPALDLVAGSNRLRGRNPFSWYDFDALAPMVRRVLQYAPIELGTARAYRNQVNGGPEAAAREEIRQVRAFMRVLTLRDYGPEHPDLKHE